MYENRHTAPKFELYVDPEGNPRLRPRRGPIIRPQPNPVAQPPSAPAMRIPRSWERPDGTVNPGADSA
jgi:hypothetical protein